MEHTYKPTKILSKSELSHKIAAIKRSKIDEMIHQAAISSLHHAKDSGDITFMTKLFEVMPKSSRRMGLKKWAMDNAPLTFDADKQTFGLKKGVETVNIDVKYFEKIERITLTADVSAGVGF